MVIGSRSGSRISLCLRNVERIWRSQAPVIVLWMRMDHKIHNKADFKGFINKENGRKRGRCTGLSESNVVREAGGGCLAHAHSGFRSQVTHRSCDFTAHRYCRA